MTSYWWMGALSMGLMSSAHCLAMCGPLAMLLPVGRIVPAHRQLAKLLYNLGRIATYTLLGLLFANLGKNMRLFLSQQYFSVALGLIIILVAFFGIGGLQKYFQSPLQGYMSQKIKALAQKPRLVDFFVFGSLNGLLPCSFVYLALVASLATAHTWQGGLFMFLFGLATTPAMFFAMVIKQKLQSLLKSNYLWLSKVYVLLFAGLLIVRGLNLGIPYLSPAFESGKAAITMCHGE